MTWRRLAFKNTLHSFRRYLGYLTASSFAVTVFFMFSCFTANSAVKHGYMTKNARYLLGGCEYIVILFAVFFILFFHAALLRLRSKEFGLFLVLGMRPSQVGRMVFLESLYLGIVAIVAGAAVGGVFLKLFLMAMSNLLQLPDPIPFEIPPVAVITTLVLFGIVFLMDGLLTSFRISRRVPKRLLIGAREQQNPPKVRLWLFPVAVAAIAFAYYQAIAHSMNLTSNFFVIVLLTATGTYLLYSQVSVLILSMLRKRPTSGVGMLVVSRFAHRMKDNARVLTVVTLLTAMVLSGMGSVFGLQSIIRQNAQHIDPFAVMLTDRQSRPLPLRPEQVAGALADNGSPASARVDIPVFVSAITTARMKNPTGVTVMAASDFERTRQVLDQGVPAIQSFLNAPAAPMPGHAVMYVPYPLVVPDAFGNVDAAWTAFPGLPRIHMDAQSDVRVLNEQSAGVVSDYLLVVSDQDYAAIAPKVQATEKYTVHGFVVPKWRDTAPVIQQLKAHLSKQDAAYVLDTVTSDTETKQMLAVMMFAGFFVSVLFFLACGSAIYFRLQAQQEVDQRQFRSLLRIGMRQSEVRRVVSMELLLLFFVPVIVADVHSVVAMMDFAHLVAVAGTAWPTFGAVCSVYVLCMVVYYLVSRSVYSQRVMQ